MTLATLARYLFLFDPRAIQDIAACRKAVWVGLVFVLSAGFAREYDGEDLLTEPWHLLLPLVASLATSFLLFCVGWIIDRGWNRKAISFLEDYRSFLGLYWMTAPLAWLYAIPVERFLSPGEAVRANLWLLAIVAFWRVALMVQVVSTVFRFTMGRAMFPVLLFADSLTVVILFLTPLPVFSIMGGIRLTESEQILQATAFFVGAVGILSWPIWLIGTVVVATRSSSSESPSTASRAYQEPPSQSVWGVAIASLAIWAFILPFTQPEQQRRRQVETLLRAGSIEQALELMSAYERTDFPPHWDPPPRIGYGEDSPKLSDVIDGLIAIKTKPWVSKLYWDKFGDQLKESLRGLDYFRYSNEKQFDRNLTILEHLPDNSSLVREHRESLISLLDDDSKLNDTQRNRLRKLLKIESDETGPPENSPPPGDQETISH